MFGFELIWCDESSSFFSYSFYEFFIYFINLTVLETISVWRIRYNDTFSDWRTHKILYRKTDIIENSSSFCISLGYLDHLRCDITCENSIFTTWIDLTSGYVLYILEYFSIEKSEFLYSKMTIESWGNITSNHHCFYGNSSRSTHWIYEWSCIFPVCKCHECCGEILFDWSFSSLTSISSLMKWITRDIEEYMGNIIHNEYENMYLSTIGEIGSIESREDSSLTHTLDCWDTLEYRSCRRCLDDDAFLSSQIISPLQTIECIIESIEIFDFFWSELDIYSIRESTPYEEFIHISVCSRTRDESILGDDLCTTESFAFTFYEWFESWLTSEDKSSCCCIDSILHARSVFEIGKISKRKPLVNEGFSLVFYFFDRWAI